MSRYAQIVKQVTEKPWAVLPGTLAVIRDLVALRANGERLSEDEIRERIGAGPPRKPASAAGGVAVIPIYGVIVPKATLFTQMSGGTSIQDLRGAYASAMNDPDVGAIVLDVDSPGGQTDLVAEFAADMRANRGRKPVLAVSNTLMASAAYWIASQADDVAVSPSSLTGSIGVFASHDDLSGAMEQVGIKTTLISAGKFKTEGNPFEPLSEDARGHLQELVDSAYQQFTGDVAKGRKVAVDQVRNGFGEGRVLAAKAAVSQGLADRVATLEQTITRAAAQTPAAARNTATAFISNAATVSTATANPVTSITYQLDPMTDVDAPAGGTGSFADKITVARCAIADLVAKGRPLTAAKTQLLDALTEDITAARALGQPRDLQAEVAAMRMRMRLAPPRTQEKN